MLIRHDSVTVEIGMEKNLIVGVEKYGLHGPEVKYVKPEGQDKIAVLMPMHKRLLSVTQALASVFLPKGFPDSVSSDYLVYQLWDTIQAFASSITGTLATQAVLKGAGVGDETATAVAATVTWLLKDGTGMVGRIVFAWCEGSDLDYNCKRWRICADILCDVAICLDLLAPSYDRAFFVQIMCLSGMCRALVGVAGGATRAALVQHQARRDNLADVNAKDGSQETLVNLAALICGLIMIPALGENQTMVWMLFFLFTGVHLAANYMAVRSVVMESLNMSRLFILVQHYILSGGEVLSLTQVNRQEPLLTGCKCPLKINLGCSLKKIFQNYGQLQRLSSIQPGSLYLLQVDIRNRTVDIALHETSTNGVYLRAVFEAMAIALCYDNTFKGSVRMPFQQLESIVAEFETGSPKPESILKSSYLFNQAEFPEFLGKLAKRGWNTDKVLLGPEEWRAMWNPEGLDYSEPKESNFY